MSRVASFDTSEPPCCVRVVPGSDVAVLGTYTLHTDGSRTGTVEVWRLGGERLAVHTAPLAVLDLKFAPTDAGCLVAAHADGSVLVWSVRAGTVALERVVPVFDPLVLATSVEWTADGGAVCVTGTHGAAAMVLVETGKSFWELETQHELECWTSAFGSDAPLDHVVVTGGDDARVIGHDVRTAGSVFQNRRLHSAGVVLILPSTASPHTLWTGGYDDRLVVLDVRTGMPRMVDEANLGGGVWRMVRRGSRVLVCCMYDGARVMDVALPVPLVEFRGRHESMCYGGDWSGSTAITCLFYDKVVEVWSSPEHHE